MTPDQLRTLKQSISHIEPHSRTLSGLFFERFFSLAPQKRHLFGGDLDARYAKFMKVIAEMVRLPLLSFAVTGIEDAESFIPGSREDGILHGALGVEAGDFPVMKAALLWALDACPGLCVSEEEREAWSAGYDVLARAMSGGMQSWQERATDDHPIQLEPGQAFLKALIDRGDILASERLPGLPPPSLAAFLADRIKESESA